MVTGNTLMSTREIQKECALLLGRSWNIYDIRSAFERVTRLYRSRGYSLARIETAWIDTLAGTLHMTLGEGLISRIDVVGMDRTRDYVVFREFPLHEGDVFEIDKANEGVNNISGTTLFEYVYLEVAYPERQPAIRIRLRERPSQLLSIGMRSDNERNLQGLLEIRDDNVAGSGSSAGLSVSGGSRNQEYGLDFTSYRILDSYLTLDAGLFYEVLDSYQYADAVVTEPNSWDRRRTGEYRDRRFGGRLAFGAQLEKIGYSTVQLSLQNVEIESKQNAAALQQEYNLTLVRLGTVLDSKNSYPFPTEGVGLNFSYEFAIEGLWGDRSYNALSASYEMFSTWGTQHTFHPRVTVGFADKTMPFGEQFRLGGRESMFGTREDDRRGRQLLLVNVEYRWKFPFQILFNAYLSIRYDLGSISEIPEQIKLSAFRHGIGAELALDTPVGPGSIGVGKSFYFLKVPPTHPIQEGPFLFYFMIGYQL
jgi:outer membrane protein assembly factor BamA